MIEGYPEEHELEEIKNWRYQDVFQLFDYIGERWQYADWGYKSNWGKDDLQHKYVVLNIELHTAGWSGNEDIIYALLENKMVRMFWYKQWRRGGHYYFEINPVNLGYKPASEWVKELGISRQAFHKSRKIDYECIKPMNYPALFRLNKVTKVHGSVASEDA